MINLRQVHVNGTKKEKLVSELNDELNNYVLNPNIRDPDGFNYRLIYANAHPEEDISGLLIHHINGNHCDNRVENLIALTELEHKRAHVALRTEPYRYIICEAAKRIFNDRKTT